MNCELKGSKGDLLIDTGVGVHEVAAENDSFVTFVVQSESPQLPPFLSSSGLRPNVEKPLSVLITHMHFDHSGGAHQFEEVPLNFKWQHIFLRWQDTLPRWQPCRAGTVSSAALGSLMTRWLVSEIIGFT